jgi:hypothetical protein
MLIYTERSRQTTETQECARLRYWTYHGVNGWGVVRIGAALEMQTGLALHAALAGILEYVVLGKWTMPDLKMGSSARLHIRKVIAAAISAYQQKVSEEGWLAKPEEGMDDELAQKYMLEQACLVEGLVWSWVKACLPRIIAEFVPVAIEGEETVVWGCTCGLGEQVRFELHERQECGGVVQQARPDILLRERASGEVGIHDFKSIKTLPSDKEIEEYRHNVQMAVGTMAAERRIGEKVTHYYVHFLKRGERKGTYSGRNAEGTGGKFEGPKIQYSDFCYVEFHAANPPMVKHQKVTITGKTPWYQRTPVWEINWDDKPAGVGQVEWLVEKLGGEITAANFALIGPYERPTRMALSYKKQVVQNEYRWADALYKIWESVEGVEEGKESMLLEDALPPSSWNCNKFGRKCGMYEVCHGEIPVAQIMESGKFVFRQPHHEPEAVAKKFWEITQGQGEGAAGQFPLLPETVDQEEALKGAAGVKAPVARGRGAKVVTMTPRAKAATVRKV